LEENKFPSFSWALTRLVTKGLALSRSFSRHCDSRRAFFCAKASQYVESANNADQYVVLANHEHPMHLQGQHLLDDPAGRRLRPDSNDDWRHDTTHRGPIQVLNLEPIRQVFP